jgi:hypothetical protein
MESFFGAEVEKLLISNYIPYWNNSLTCNIYTKYIHKSESWGIKIATDAPISAKFCHSTGVEKH